MRRAIVCSGADQLKYEIREIVAFAQQLQRWKIPIIWENIGDPVQKGERIAPWIKEIVQQQVASDCSYAYSETEGLWNTREFLANLANKRNNRASIPSFSTSSCSPLTPQDIIFFNGLGDAISKVFGFLRREARVLGPSPAYSTLSSAEAAHSGYEHLTYRLDPHNNWMPDIEDIELKVKYNDSIAGLLLINPDNPTGAIYPVEVLEELVRIARNYDLFIIADETYANIVYDEGKTAALSRVIGDVPGIALRSISKEIPWPGARSGWIEVYNRNADPQFSAYIQTLIAAKRLEVCSTRLPQQCIPPIMGDSRYLEHLRSRAAMFKQRAEEAVKAFEGCHDVTVIQPEGAFYTTATFDPILFDAATTGNHRLPVKDSTLASFIEEQTATVAPDKRFVYWLLASTGICVVPLSGFASDLPGFRFTLLESDDQQRNYIFSTLAQASKEYLGDS